MIGLDDWIGAGDWIVHGGHKIFVREMGRGPDLLFLHGFPSSSWDWNKIAPALARDYRCLFFDFLGFGASDKPRRFNYSYTEQIVLTLAVMRHFEARRVSVIAHDYGVTVGQELLRRAAVANHPQQFERMLFLNGGLYAHLHRALPIQKLMRKPVIGFILSRLSSEKHFAASFRQVFGGDHQPSEEEITDHWRAINRQDGHRLTHRLLHYIGERALHGDTLAEVLEATTVPLAFVWGLADPVSGAHMIDEVERRVDRAQITRLSGIGHYPQLEVPDAVEQAVASFCATVPE